jgi:hypothetical protein
MAHLIQSSINFHLCNMNPAVCWTCQYFWHCSIRRMVSLIW